MKITGRIEDLSDIKIKDKPDRNTGEVTKVATIRFLTTKPSQLIDVQISADLMGDGKTLAYLKQSIEKKIDLSLEFKEMAFAGEDNKFVGIKGFYLYESPAPDLTSAQKT